MTKRQRIKEILIDSARRTHFKSRDDFKLSAIGTLDFITDPDLNAELDRIEYTYKGITRLISEAWNVIEKNQAQDRSDDAMVAMLTRRQKAAPCPISAHLDELLADGWIDKDLNPKSDF